MSRPPPDRLWALFSGVPPSKRDQRLIMGLQGFVDDSKHREDVLVLAGYFAPWGRWQQFTIEWQLLLDEDPPWDEFKMSRAIRHLGRAERFYALVEKYAMGSIRCVVEIEPLRRICADLDLHKSAANPYLFAFKAITSHTYKQLRGVGLQEPFEFIFDDRGEETVIRDAWKFYEYSVPDDMKGLVSRKPRFEKSHEVLPLQAAEIIAWHTRKHYVQHRELALKIDYPWKQPNPVPGYAVWWTYDEMRPYMEQIRDDLQVFSALLDAGATDEEIRSFCSKRRADPSQEPQSS